MENQKLKNTEQFLTEKGIEFVSASNGEFRTKCVFSNCDENHKTKDAHLYIGKNGMYQCFKCGAKGNLITLCQQMGWNVSDGFENPIVKKENLDNKANYFSKSFDKISKDFLLNRGLSEKTIIQSRLGYSSNRKSIAIPHIKGGEVINIHYRNLVSVKGERGYYFEIGREMFLYNTGFIDKSIKECYLFEGEFDCLIAQQLGIKNCLSVPNGAKAPEKWKDYFDSFEKIYICFDNDDIGQEAARKTTSLLGWQKCWNIVLPKNKGKDMTDYFLKGGDLTNFLKLVNSAEHKEIAPEQQKLDNEKIITPVNEILKMEEIEDPFLIEPMIVENSINALTSDSGKGKSVMMLKMVEAIVKGEKFLGEFDTKKTKTLILDLEMSRNDLIQRVHSIVQTEIDGLDFFFLQSFNIEKEFSWLEQQIKEKKYGLIVFDTLSAIHEREENSNTDMEPILKKFLELTNRIKITVLFLHHHRKTQKGEFYSQSSSRGAGKIIEKAACHLLLDSRDIKVIDKDTGADMNGLSISIEQHKRRQLKKLNKFGVNVWNNPFTNLTTFDWTGYIETEITKEDKAKELIIEFLKENSMATMTMIKEMINKNKNIGRENIKNACKSLVEIGKIVFTQGEGKNHATKYYSMPEKTEKLGIKY